MTCFSIKESSFIKLVTDYLKAMKYESSNGHTWRISPKRCRNQQNVYGQNIACTACAAQASLLAEPPSQAVSTTYLHPGPTWIHKKKMSSSERKSGNWIVHSIHTKTLSEFTTESSDQISVESYINHHKFHKNGIFSVNRGEESVSTSSFEESDSSIISSTTSRTAAKTIRAILQRNIMITPLHSFSLKPVQKALIRQDIYRVQLWTVSRPSPTTKINNTLLE